MTYRGLRLEFEDGVARLILDNPPLNSLPLAVSDQFPEVADEICASTARVLIITGVGRYFCSGADPADLDVDVPAWEFETYARRAQQSLRSLVRTGRPAIAAINGLCVGFGLELALNCHLRVASEQARFAAPEPSFGFPPVAGGTQLLPRLIGPGRAYQVILTGDSVSAEQAGEWGLVNRVVKHERCLAAATQLARRIATKGALAVAGVLDAVERGLEVPLAEGLRIEADRLGILGDSSDRREGFRAFIEERVPQFREGVPHRRRYLES